MGVTVRAHRKALRGVSDGAPDSTRPSCVRSQPLSRTGHILVRTHDLRKRANEKEKKDIMSMHIRLSTASAVAALALVPVHGLLAQVAPASQAEVLADSTFIRQAISGNLLEVRLATVARSKASNGSVKD